MEARQILDIRSRLVSTANAVRDISELAKQTEVYDAEADELRQIYSRMMEMFCDFKLEQAE